MIVNHQLHAAGMENSFLEVKKWWRECQHSLWQQTWGNLELCNWHWVSVGLGSSLVIWQMERACLRSE